jgi:hypothetical protein
MKQEIGGGCHCGKVRFSCHIDLEAPTIRCNCSICSKARYWLAPIQAADFRLLQGEEALSEYRFAGGDVVHHFCRTCGIKTFGQASSPAFGGRFFGVNVACLELAPEQLAVLPVAFNDGRNDRHGQAPAISSYL